MAYQAKFEKFTLRENIDLAVIEWQPIIDSLSQSVIVLPRILIVYDEYTNV